MCRCIIFNYSFSTNCCLNHREVTLLHTAPHGFRWYCYVWSRTHAEVPVSGRCVLIPERLGQRRVFSLMHQPKAPVLPTMREGGGSDRVLGCVPGPLCKVLPRCVRPAHCSISSHLLVFIHVNAASLRFVFFYFDHMSSTGLRADNVRLSSDMRRVTCSHVRQMLTSRFLKGRYNNSYSLQLQKAVE